MNYANIKYCDIANGIGVRTSLFVSGCRLHCAGCFNSEAWGFDAGEAFTPEVEQRILDSLEPSYVDGLTVLGGEPTEPENAEALAPFLERVRQTYPTKDLWMYTGRTWEQITEGGSHASPNMDRILACLDVLVDGPWVSSEYDISLRFRGSSNQRLIDVPATLAAHRKGTLSGNDVVLWEDDPVFSSHTMD